MPKSINPLLISFPCFPPYLAIPPEPGIWLSQTVLLFVHFFHTYKKMILDIHVSFALALVCLTVLSIFIWQELNNFNSLIRLYFIYATFKNPFLLSYTFIVILKMSTWHKFNPLSRSLIWGTRMVICLFSLFFLLKINFFFIQYIPIVPPHTHTLLTAVPHPPLLILYLLVTH